MFFIINVKSTILSIILMILKNICCLKWMLCFVVRLWTYIILLHTLTGSIHEMNAHRKCMYIHLVPQFKNIVCLCHNHMPTSYQITEKVCAILRNNRKRCKKRNEKSMQGRFNQENLFHWCSRIFPPIKYKLINNRFCKTL